MLAVICFMRVVNSVFQLYLLIKDLTDEMVRRRERNTPLIERPNIYQQQIMSLNRLVNGSDKHCHDNLRVNRHVFMKLCLLLKQRGLEDSRNVTVVEKVAIFLWILSHHTKNRRTDRGANVPIGGP